MSQPVDAALALVFRQLEVPRQRMETLGAKGAQAGGCISSCTPPFANHRTERRRGVRGTSLCPQFLSQWGNRPSILLVGKNNQTCDCFRNL